MTLFKPSKMETAFFKAGIYGEAGAGKTFTAKNIAIGLHKHIQSKKPICFFDSEQGSDFVIKYFEKEKIKLLVFKSRSFADLIDATKEIEKTADIAIIDSVSHPWTELMESYIKKHELKFIRLKDWSVLKPTWREFSYWYLNSSVHIIICGRAADQFDMVTDETGVSELQKTGTRMRTEKELGYEPSLLVEMEHHPASITKGARWVHRAWIVKDRTDELNGKFFDNPSFENFLPHIKSLNLKGKHKPMDTQKSTEQMFNKKETGYDKVKRKEIIIDRINAEIADIYPGRSTEDIQNKRELMRAIFETPSWKEIQAMRFDDLEVGLKKILEFREEITVKKEDKKGKEKKK